MDTENVKKSFSCSFHHKKLGPTTEHAMATHGLKCVPLIQEKLFQELNKLKNGQDLIAMHHKFLKEFNASIDVDGTLNGEKFEKILNEIRNDLDIKFQNEKEHLMKGCKNNEAALEALSKKYEPFFKFVDETLKNGQEMRKGGKIFSKEQQERLYKNVEMDMDDISTENQMQTQKVTRLVNETHETHSSAKMMLKTLHDTFLDIIRKMRIH